MATGDILSVTIPAEGYYAEILIEGLATGGTYALGLGTNNTVSASTKLVFTAVSLGYDDTGAATTITRTIYGTIKRRQITPNDALADETTSGSNVIVRVNLSEYIYQKDNVGAGNSGTAPVVSILAGLYTNGTANNASGANFPVTNNSTLAYPRVIGNWAWPGYQLMDSTSKLRAVAFHKSAQLGRPVRAVKFSVTDGTTTNTQTITTPTCDLTFGDASPDVEYVSTSDLTSGLTQKAELTCNFIAYPWMGDSGSLLDTSAGTADPTPLYGPIKAVCDRTGTYEKTYALVDPTGSDAGANTVYPSASFDPVTAYKFLTIGKAAAAIAAYNNATYGRNDVGAGIVYLNAGSYAWLGSSNTYGTTPKTWITIKPAAGVLRADVIIASASGNGDISDRIKIENCTITATALNLFTNVAAIWHHTCEFNTTNTGLWNTTGGIFYVTQCQVTALSQGLRPNSTANCSPALVRGNNLTGFRHGVLCYTVIGNLKTTKYTPSSALFFTEINGMTGPQPVNFIIAYNNILGWEVGAGVNIIDTGTYIGPNTVGGAIVQNVFENCQTSGGGLGSICASDAISTNTPLENIIIWHNVFLGQRLFLGYNDAGTITKYRRHWSIKNNYWDRSANKGDTFSPANANRIGAWEITNQVAASGNVHEQNMMSLPNNFFMEFAGISSYQPALGGTLTHAEFVDRQASDGSTTSAGGGDYRLQPTSPLIGLPVDIVLLYDLDGTLRTTNNNAAGAYSIFDPGGGASTSSGSGSTGSGSTGSGSTGSGSTGSGTITSQPSVYISSNYVFA